MDLKTLFVYGSVSFKILSSNAKVSVLIDLDTNWWSMQLLNGVFNEDDIEEILRCQLVL